ncbi:ABC transporter substrate-binding protein [Dissulfuribacter thermophilus]|uniref:ABC transporter substrate-binding protein n=1 Tax=Dissulfuribacter thermophilus TaxID=1156395 RepID=A0A1B9F3U4_9BACT|nr:ABC transporter substrate binding protein [Dissulfuribacter thermophilus]OCC14590.1 ABC transporter substrate-binding protein [Dissulfuribacter thermophilus]
MTNFNLKKILFILITLTSLLITSKAYPQANKPDSDLKILIIISSNHKSYLEAYHALVEEIIKRYSKAKIMHIIIDEEYLLILKKLKKTFLPSLIISIGTEATIKAINLFPNTLKVFTMVLDPNEKILNAQKTYGVALDVPYKKILKELTRICPETRLVGTIYTNEGLHHADRLHRISNEMGFDFLGLKLNTEKDIERQFKPFIKKVQAIIAIPDPNVFNSIITPRIIYFSIKFKRPFVGLSKNFTASGALFSLDSSFSSIGRQTALLSLKLLRKEHIDHKIEYPNFYTVYLNIRTAKVIGLNIKRDILHQFKVIEY